MKTSCCPNVSIDPFQEINAKYYSLMTLVCIVWFIIPFNRIKNLAVQCLIFGLLRDLYKDSSSKDLYT